MHTGQKNREWQHVSRSSPCPVCARRDWCRVGVLYVHCMRVESDKPCPRGGWLHRREGADLASFLELPPKPPPVPDKEFASRWGPFVLTHLAVGSRVQELARELDVAPWALERLRVGWSGENGGEWIFPEKNHKGQYTGITRRLVHPRPDGPNKLCGKDSRRGLFYAVDWLENPGPVYVVEGGSDAAAGLSIGLCVVGRPSAIAGADVLAKLLAGIDRRIIVLGEQDRKRRQDITPPHDGRCTCCMKCYPGRYGMLHTAQALKDSLHRRVETMMLLGFKDLREYVRSLRLDYNNKEQCWRAGEWLRRKEQSSVRR